MKTKKTALILLIALAISTVSCVDNTVSPQVEAIRAQQVEWMKAKTALATADANFRKAQADFEAANNAFRLKETEAFLAISLKEAEASLANAKANLERALNNLTVIVANSGDIQAKEYLNNYKNEANELDNLYNSRVTIQNIIITLTAQLNSTTQAAARVAIEANIGLYKKELDAVNVAITAQEKIVAYWKGLLDKIFTA